MRLIALAPLSKLQLAFDGDDAGQAACERFLKRLLPQLCACDLKASVISLHQGRDAVDLLCRGGRLEWTRIPQRVNTGCIGGMSVCRRP